MHPKVPNVYTTQKTHSKIQLYKGSHHIPIVQFFLTLFKGGGAPSEGGSNPCSKMLLQIFYYSKGLFGNIIDMKDFFRAKMSQIEGKIVTTEV